MSNAATIRRAATIREAVREARREGALGPLPAGVKIGVRSGVDIIYIEISAAPDDWSAEAGPSDSFPFGRRIGSAEVCALATLLHDVAREQAPGWTTRVLLSLPDCNVVYLDQATASPVAGDKEN